MRGIMGAWTICSKFYVPSIGEPSSTGKPKFDAALEATDDQLREMINILSGVGDHFNLMMLALIEKKCTVVVDGKKYFSTSRMLGGEDIC